MILNTEEADSMPVELEGDTQQPILNTEDPEEAIVSMHATSGNHSANTIQFKGQIGNQPVFALIDSGSTHSFVNPNVLNQHSAQIIITNPMIVMVVNGAKMVNAFSMSSTPI
jgi:hypothetical protein